MTKTAADAILGTLGTRKKGITAKDIASKTNRNLSTVQSTLRDLEDTGHVRTAGVVETGKRGRPPLLWVSA